ncbi:hypothetical protein GGX14DRAFT_555295 [Mycena pura]|uniref:Extracellular membrane protein CFEM domain-containing protein n=1 Tax=Mycena pura TaxID=153505 RepID=A0AAD6YRC9_9AGAR|nr:hypothetical protein GGX14DRAFT_555295 [Mycena pura]
MFSHTIVFLVCAAVPFAAAHPAPDAAAQPSLVNFGNLDFSSAPKACRSSCLSFTHDFDKSCTADIKCLCTDKLGAALRPCFSCVANTNTTQAAMAARIVLDEWANVCTNAGMAVATPSVNADIGAADGTTVSTSAEPAAVSAPASASSTDVSASASGSVSASASSASSSASNSAEYSVLKAQAVLGLYSLCLLCDGRTGLTSATACSMKL